MRDPVQKAAFAELLQLFAEDINIDMRLYIEAEISGDSGVTTMK